MSQTWRDSRTPGRADAGIPLPCFGLHERKIKQVDQAIVKLVRENKPVNFNTVAITAGVTKAYLYNHPLLRDRIETLRASQVRKAEPQLIPSQRTEKSQAVLLAANLPIGTTSHISTLCSTVHSG